VRFLISLEDWTAALEAATSKAETESHRLAMIKAEANDDAPPRTPPPWTIAKLWEGRGPLSRDEERVAQFLDEYDRRVLAYVRAGDPYGVARNRVEFEDATSHRA
jgi:hypothetical protein